MPSEVYTTPIGFVQALRVPAAGRCLWPVYDYYVRTKSHELGLQICSVYEKKNGTIVLRHAGFLLRKSHLARHGDYGCDKICGNQGVGDNQTRKRRVKSATSQHALAYGSASHVNGSGKKTSSLVGKNATTRTLE